MFNYNDLEKYNSEVKDWTDKSRVAIMDETDALAIKRYQYSRNPQPLKKALKAVVRLKGLLPEKISYKMPKSGVYVSKGVSRGHPISNPRTAKDWFNAPIDKNIDELGDIVADNTGNMIVNALKIK